MVVDTAVYGPCTRPCTCTVVRVRGPCIARCTQPSKGRVRGRVQTVYTSIRPCTQPVGAHGCRCTVRVHSRVPCTRTVHGPEHRPYTAVCTASTRPSIRTTALVSEDVKEVMLGTDWLEANDCVCDFKTGKLCIGGQPATTLSRCGYIKCRRVLV